jgi:hypothetical protein
MLALNRLSRLATFVFDLLADLVLGSLAVFIPLGLLHWLSFHWTWHRFCIWGRRKRGSPLEGTPSRFPLGLRFSQPATLVFVCIWSSSLAFFSWSVPLAFALMVLIS